METTMNPDNGNPIQLAAGTLQGPDSPKREPGGTFVAPRDELELQLTRIWEQVLDIPNLGVRENYFDLVSASYKDNRLIDHVSMRAVTMFGEIAAETGKILPVATLLQAPTVEQLANVLRQEAPSLPWSSLVAMQPHGSKPPFFLIHAAGAHVIFGYYLAHRLGPDQPFYGLQSRGLDGKQPPDTRMEHMAAHYIEEIRTVQPEGPYFLGGKSFGGMTAFEMAQQLHQQGQQVALLALFDTYRPGFTSLFPDPRSLRERNRTDLHLRNLKRLRPSEMLTYVLARVRNVAQREKRRMRNRTLAIATSFYQGLGRPLPSELQYIKSANYKAFNEYKPQVYSGKVTLFRARTQLRRMENVPDMGWGELVSGAVEVHDVPGEHSTMFYEPHVNVLAEKLSACLAQAQATKLAGKTLAWST
jgi:thioesterase domain-containing protein